MWLLADPEHDVIHDILAIRARNDLRSTGTGVGYHCQDWQASVLLEVLGGSVNRVQSRGLNSPLATSPAVHITPVNNRNQSIHEALDCESTLLINGDGEKF